MHKGENVCRIKQSLKEAGGREGLAPGRGSRELESAAAFGSHPEAEEPGTRSLWALAVTGEDGGQEPSEAARPEGTARGQRRRV